MANFKDSPIFSTHDDYYTPKSAWENIKPFVEKKGYKKVWECFLLGSNEQSKYNLSKLGFSVIGNKNVDFLNDQTHKDFIDPLTYRKFNKDDYDIIISNPPFQRIKSYKQRKDNLKYKCLQKLLELDKPFIILMNSTNMFQKWFMELFQGKDIKFIFPSKKIQYNKYKEGGKEQIDAGNGCSFNSIYVTYKVLDKNEWI